MFKKVIETRAMARTAVAGLAVGLLVLAGLAVWSTAITQRATDRVRTLNAASDVWGRVFQAVNLEESAAHDYIRAGSELGRRPLASAIGSATADLTWLTRHGGPEDAESAKLVEDTYAGYTDTLREMLKLGAATDQTRLEELGEQADLGATSLRKQIAANIERRRLETTFYLDEVDQRNRLVRMAATAAIVVDLALLVLCALVLIGNQRRIERQAAESHHKALHDALTGLANRALLADRTAHAVSAASRNGETVGLLVLDLDRFKEVNDSLGHHVGDFLLQQVADRVTGAVREMDMVARLGGDEFAVLLPRLGGQAEALQIAERIMAALERPLHLDGRALEVSGSIGLALYPDQSGDTEQLLQHADHAMYNAKRHKLGVATYDPALENPWPAQITLFGELTRAMTTGELILHYQPKADLTDARIAGLEALVRWQHPDRGLLGPDEFVALAAESGMMEPLTRYIVSAALRQCDEWALAGMRLPVAVNVGAQCMHNPAFPGQVADLLAEHTVPPGMLTIELTESTIITDPDKVLQVLGELRSLGVRLSLDDFGTGYSSMAYLRDMPVHELKIDRYFVTGMESDPPSKAIVRAVLDLARNFHVEVVAEGVEDASTWTALRTLGCDFVQGHYLSRPMPAGDVAGWLARYREHHVQPSA